MGELGSKFRREISTSYIPLPRQYLLHLACAPLEGRGYFQQLQQHVLTIKPHLPRATAALTKRKQQQYQAKSGTKMRCSPAKCFPQNIISYKNET